MPIQILNSHVAAQIAAGEVIERPASVVKELIENSLDSGARVITVEITQGGIEFIRVTDDGCGIPANEIETAFQRHATSKVQTADDLTKLTTLGFRGEALPSIAAVSKLEIVSRAANIDAGTWLRIENGQVTARKPYPTPPGTAVTVSDLFHNIPARRKHLKSAASETTRIHALTASYALAFTNVRILLLGNGRTLFRSTGSGASEDVLIAHFGAETASQMLPVTSGDDKFKDVRVEGVASPPSISRSTRNSIILFVNQRWIQSRALNAAVEGAYRGLLQVRRYPVAVLSITLPLDEVDVNVHPAKTEVRFLYEREIFSAVQHAVWGALSGRTPVPEIRWRNQSTQTNQMHISRFSSNDAPPQRVSFFSHPTSRTNGAAGGSFSISEEKSIPLLRVVGQVGTTYIVAEGPDGVFLIDQHAAHECVIYEQVLYRLNSPKPEMQGLLEPIPVELAPEQIETIAAYRSMLESFGFQFDYFGEQTLLLRSVPAVSYRAPAITLFSELIGIVTKTDDNPQQLHEKLAASIACHSAVRAGMVLNPLEMTALIEELERAKNARTCPHGRPTMLHLSASLLEREFGRR
jgi:DNA mismatch repair protein MutL